MKPTPNNPKLPFDQACAQYVHRFTMEHVPQWARAQREDGTYYAPQFRSDREWYENTLFPPHEMCHKTDSYTTGQTWPLGQSLPEPYQIGYKGPGWEYKPYPQPEPFKPSGAHTTSSHLPEFKCEAIKKAQP